MTNKNILLLFSAAGLVLALVLGVYFYRTNLGPTKNEVTALLQSFVDKISAGDLNGARSLMTEETRKMLREPGTVLGQRVYQDLKLKTVDSVFSDGNGGYAADVILTAPDSMKIMTKAGLLFAERVTEEGPAEDPDQLIAEIYEEILARDDVPVLDNFCVVRMEMRNGILQIVGDLTLQKAIEGGERIETGENSR